MSHEHHGNCCLTEEHHIHAAALQHLSRACCAGACIHPQHIAAMQSCHATGEISFESIFGTSLSPSDKKKKNKKKLGAFGLQRVSTGAVERNLAQLI